jgi:hypothetical protein
LIKVALGHCYFRNKPFVMQANSFVMPFQLLEALPVDILVLQQENPAENVRKIPKQIRFKKV